MTRFLFFLALVCCCNAQRFGFGVKAGARLTGDMEGRATSESKRYIVGPMVEVQVWRRCAVEFDALYSRFGYRTGDAFFGSSYAEQVRGNVWEFPILGKYRFGSSYAILGYAPRTYYGFSRDLDFRTTHGLVAGGGIEIGQGRLRFAPEARYTRWNADPIGISGSRGFYIAGPQNEVKLLLGIRLGARR